MSSVITKKMIEAIIVVMSAQLQRDAANGAAAIVAALRLIRCNISSQKHHGIFTENVILLVEQLQKIAPLCDAASSLEKNPKTLGHLSDVVGASAAYAALMVLPGLKPFGIKTFKPETVEKYHEAARLDWQSTADANQCKELMTNLENVIRDELAKAEAEALAAKADAEAPAAKAEAEAPTATQTALDLAKSLPKDTVRAVLVWISTEFTMPGRRDDSDSLFTRLWKHNRYMLTDTDVTADKLWTLVEFMKLNAPVSKFTETNVLTEKSTSEWQDFHNAVKALCNTDPDCALTGALKEALEGLADNGIVPRCRCASVAMSGDAMSDSSFAAFVKLLECVPCA